MGFSVDRVAGRGEPPKRTYRVGRIEQGPRPRPGGEDGDVAVEPDDNAAGEEQRPAAGVEKRATTGREHAKRALRQPRDRGPLQVAEQLFAGLREDVSDGEAGLLLDRRIRILEGQMEARGEPAADRRLARTGQADQRDRIFRSFRPVRHQAGAIQAAPRWGKRRAMPKYSFSQPRRRRNPIGLILLAILVLFVGFLIWLGVRSNEVPQQRIEQDVTNAVNGR